MNTFDHLEHVLQVVVPYTEYMYTLPAQQACQFPWLNQADQLQTRLVRASCSNEGMG